MKIAMRTGLLNSSKSVVDRCAGGLQSLREAFNCVDLANPKLRTV